MAGSAAFEAVQLLLKSRHPTVTPSAVISDPTLLTGLIHCAKCGGLKAIRDQAKADAERAQAMLQNSGSQAVTPQMLSKFARSARQRIRLEGGGYPATICVRSPSASRLPMVRSAIMGSKSRLLQTLVANGGTNAVPTQGLRWRRGWDSNPR